MSFDRLPSLESQPRSTGYSDDPTFDRLTNTLSSHLFRLNNNVNRLSQQIALMGTPKDSETIRDRVKMLLEQTKEEFKQVGEGIKKVQGWENVSVGSLEPFRYKVYSPDHTVALTAILPNQALSPVPDQPRVLSSNTAPFCREIPTVCTCCSCSY